MIKCVYRGGYRSNDVTMYHNEMLDLPMNREEELLRKFPQWFISVHKPQNIVVEHEILINDKDPIQNNIEPSEKEIPIRSEKKHSFRKKK